MTMATEFGAANASRSVTKHFSFIARRPTWNILNSSNRVWPCRPKRPNRTIAGGPDRGIHVKRRAWITTPPQRRPSVATAVMEGSAETTLMNRFDEKLASHGLNLRRNSAQTLQVNVGRKCNQTCRHCHVDAAPWRKEMMNAEVAGRVGDWIRQHRPAVVDITGGAPELSEHFKFLVETARETGCRVIDRNNLTIIETPAFGWLPEYLAAHEVEIIASLPCYLEQK